MVLLELLDVRIFLCCLLLEKDQKLLKVLCFFETGGLAESSCCRRRVSQGWQKHFSFVQAKYSAGVMHLCSAYEAADYLLEALKTFDGSIWCVRYALVRGSGRMHPLSPSPGKNLEPRGCICWLSVSPSIVSTLR